MWVPVAVRLVANCYTPFTYFTLLYFTRLTALCPGLPGVSRYQKGKTNLDFTEARDSEWHWHQLGYVQVCISFQTETMPALHLTGCASCRLTNSVKALKATLNHQQIWQICTLLVFTLRHLLLAAICYFAVGTLHPMISSPSSSPPCSRPHLSTFLSHCHFLFFSILSTLLRVLIPVQTAWDLYSGFQSAFLVLVSQYIIISDNKIRPFCAYTLVMYTFLRARRYASAGTSYGPVSVCVCPCLSLVCHKSVLYRNGWTNQTGFWHGSFVMLQYVIRKFGYLQKGYFPLELYPKTPDLKNFATGYRSSNRVIDLAR